MRSKLTLLVAFAIIGGVSPVLAGEGAEEGKRPCAEDKFTKLDTDGDEKISLEEFKAAPFAEKLGDKVDALFEKLDADDDGFLTLEELKSGHGRKGKCGKRGKRGKHGGHEGGKKDNKEN